MSSLVLCACSSDSYDSHVIRGIISDKGLLNHEIRHNSVDNHNNNNNNQDVYYVSSINTLLYL